MKRKNASDGFHPWGFLQSCFNGFLLGGAVVSSIALASPETLTPDFTARAVCPTVISTKAPKVEPEIEFGKAIVQSSDEVVQECPSPVSCSQARLVSAIQTRAGKIARGVVGAGYLGAHVGVEVVRKTAAVLIWGATIVGPAWAAATLTKDQAATTQVILAVSAVEVFRVLRDGAAHFLEPLLVGKIGRFMCGLFGHRAGWGVMNREMSVNDQQVLAQLAENLNIMTPSLREARLSLKAYAKKNKKADLRDAVNGIFHVITQAHTLFKGLHAEKHEVIAHFHNQLTSRVEMNDRIRQLVLRRAEAALASKSPRFDEARRDPEAFRRFVAVAVENWLKLDADSHDLLNWDVEAETLAAQP